MDIDPLKNQLPYKLVKTNDQLQCRWMDTLGMRFTEPFFEETIMKCRSARANPRMESVSDMQMLAEWSAPMPDIKPAAIIFHISRCGSTLLSQLLATLPQHIVLSEVPLFDEILRLPLKDTGFNEKDTSSLLAAALQFYGQSDDCQSHVFIKADCWHLFFYEQLRRLYPEVPFIILYRSPDAVFRSHKKMSGMHVVRYMIEPQLFGFEPDGPVFENQDIYIAAVIASYLKKSLEIAENDSNTLLLNYNEGPMQMIDKIASFAGISLTAQELGSMEERSRYHSKKPGERFGEEPVRNVEPVLHDAMKAYQKLDKKRTCQ
ncbi:MAG: sulfotransferase [Bacteroidota bacterium]